MLAAAIRDNPGHPDCAARLRGVQHPCPAAPCPRKAAAPSPITAVDLRDLLGQLTVLPLILGGFLVVDLTHAGQLLETSTPDKLPLAMKRLGVLLPERAGTLIAIVTRCREKLGRRPTATRPTALAIAE